jgi:hypothetical protein
MRPAFATPRVELDRATQPDDEEPTAKQPEHLRLLALSFTDEAEEVDAPPSGIRPSSALVDAGLTSEVVPVAARSANVDVPRMANAPCETPSPAKPRSTFVYMIVSGLVAAAMTVVIFASIVGLPHASLVRITRSMRVLDVHRAVTTQPPLVKARKRPLALPAAATFPKRPKWSRPSPSKPAPAPVPVAARGGGIVRTVPF